MSRMTEKLYWRDAYLREFDAKILSIEGNKVQLNQTAFNPRGGGLVSDLGKLNSPIDVGSPCRNEEKRHVEIGGKC
jgi:Ser-tRNA(Ala) deacylase AlaX